MKLILSAVTAFGLLAGPAAAVVVGYSNQIDFDDAVMGRSLIQSEDFSTNIAPTASVVTPSGIAITSHGSTFNTFDNPFGRFLQSYVDGTYDPGTSEYQTWTVAAGTYAIGFKFRGAGASLANLESVRITIDPGSGNSPIEIKALAGDRNGYVGFVSDTPFTSILFDGTGGPGDDDYYIGDVTTYGGLPSVPLPAGLPLLACALVGVAGLKRRSARV